jgi:Lar family restriction alleviation protein
VVELLPCPFCGGTEIENTWDDYWSLMQRCVTCGAQGGVVEDNDPNCKTEVEKRAKAIELWNQRTTLHVKFTHSETAFTTINNQVFIPLEPKVQRLA